jgi:hypothetical protein
VTESLTIYSTCNGFWDELRKAKMDLVDVDRDDQERNDELTLDMWGRLGLFGESCLAATTARLL